LIPHSFSCGKARLLVQYGEIDFLTRHGGHPRFHPGPALRVAVQPSPSVECEHSYCQARARLSQCAAMNALSPLMPR
jgi:hypothetical protein